MIKRYWYRRALVATVMCALCGAAGDTLAGTSALCPYTWFQVKNASLVLPSRLYRDARLFAGKVGTRAIERALGQVDLLQADVSRNKRSAFELLTSGWRGQMVCSDASADWGSSGFPAPSALSVGNTYLLVLDQSTPDGRGQVFFDNAGIPLLRTLQWGRIDEIFIVGAVGRPIVLTTGTAQMYRPLAAIALDSDKVASVYSKHARLDAPVSLSGELIGIDLASFFAANEDGTHDAAAKAMLGYFSVRNDTDNVRVLQENLAQTRGIISKPLRQQLRLRSRSHQ